MKTYRCTLLSVFLLFTLTACANDSQMAVGKITPAELFTQYPQFAQAYHDFELPAQEQLQVKDWPQNLQVTAYFGTWCHDSEREVPKMLKLLALNSAIKIRLIALDGKKSDPQGLANDAGISFTPTFVITLDDKEVGRIIERPENTLITDINVMLAI